MSKEREPQHEASSVLRLRPRVPTELIRHGQRIKLPDGPMIPHPELIDEDRPSRNQSPGHEPDVTMNDYRSFWKDRDAERLQKIKATGEKPDFEIKAVFQYWPLPSMQELRRRSDDEITEAIERHYVGAQVYISPGTHCPPSFVDRCGADWGMNARGIYYRHYYSPGWVTADRSLWLPSLDGQDWNAPAEQYRRIRAKVLLGHILDNEKWNKSEFAWEADAWADVFGPMRDDPLLAVDKHEYNAMGQKRHEVSCLLTGESKFIKRIPDATFGLATSQPEHKLHDEECLAESNLDSARLEALALHRHCGLLSDPRWGDASLVFPFAVYEAKGWGGDARETRRQACSAAAAYLDLLDKLSKQPGLIGERGDAYQTAQSRNSQVFAFTSYGAHWHILVGYKRPRLYREHAGRQGLSESVYVFQRIWSGRVTTERKAWELLSFIDQIHLWGVTDFRDFVIQHLTPWHKFGTSCLANDAKYTASLLKTDFHSSHSKYPALLPEPCVELPKWTQYLTEDTQLKLQQKACRHLYRACVAYGTGNRVSDEFPDMVRCVIDQCGPREGPGYPLPSVKEQAIHLRDIHGATDFKISWLRGQKRRLEDTGDDMDARSKKKT